MINSSIGVHGSLWVFGGISLLGAFFILCFVKETRGKSDYEKKTLYSPLTHVIPSFVSNVENVEM